MSLTIGTTAPAFEAMDSHEHLWKVPENFKGKKLALFFLRHLGCPLCLRRADELARDYEKFKQLGSDIMVIVQSTQQRVETYSKKKRIAYPLVGDKEKKIYSLYEVERGGLRAFLAPQVLKASAAATLKGYMHGPLDGDELQKPAAFIIGTNGKIEWAHYGETIADAVSSDIILRQLGAAK